MCDTEDAEETIDIHDYTRQRLEERDIDPEENPHQTREFINQVAGSYLIQVDTRDLEDYEYHYISIVRIEDLVGSAQEKFHEEVERYVTEISDVSDMPDEELLELAESAGRFTIGNNVTLSYSMAYELVEDLMRRLIPEILRDDVEDRAGQVLVSQLSAYSGKADVLQACRVIGKTPGMTSVISRMFAMTSSMTSRSGTAYRCSMI